MILEIDKEKAPRSLLSLFSGIGRAPVEIVEVLQFTSVGKTSN
jgi:hypothetical protein